MYSYISTAWPHKFPGNHLCTYHHIAFKASFFTVPWELCCYPLSARVNFTVPWSTFYTSDMKQNVIRMFQNNMAIHEHKRDAWKCKLTSHLGHQLTCLTYWMILLLTISRDNWRKTCLRSIQYAHFIWYSFWLAHEFICGNAHYLNNDQYFLVTLKVEMS